MNEGRATPIPTSAEVAAGEGRIIEAIKIVREVEGLGLKEAKDRVELYIAQNPALRERIDLKRRESRKQLIKWVLVIDAIVAAGALYWLFWR